ncbi:hypothetical protein [Streptomyces sp. b94]|uniref:hypothetical protein n=1 Tax=Streptomyces sp. b94 TaxID=1827634 RepID=UPI001B396BC4|nr:hypothetical protein [Streptomyces sp. b94]
MSLAPGEPSSEKTCTAPAFCTEPQLALYRAGESADEVTKRQLAVCLLAFVATAW